MKQLTTIPINHKLIKKFDEYEQDIEYIDNKSYLEVFNYSISFDLNELNLNDNWTDEELFFAHEVLKGNSVSKFPNYNTYWQNNKFKAIELLEKDKSTRQAVIHFGYLDLIPSCLVSIQFFIRHKKLDVYANYRSWHLKNYATYDLCLLTQMANDMISHFPRRTLGTLTVNAVNAHIDYRPHV